MDNVKIGLFHTGIDTTMHQLPHISKISKISPIYCGHQWTAEHHVFLVVRRQKACLNVFMSGIRISLLAIHMVPEDTVKTVIT